MEFGTLEPWLTTFGSERIYLVFFYETVVDNIDFHGWKLELVELWLTTFGSERIYLVFFDETVVDNIDFHRWILEFVEINVVNHGFIEKNEVYPFGTECCQPRFESSKLHQWK